MRNRVKYFTVCILLCMLVISGCRSEESIDFTGPNTDGGIKANSVVATLIRNVASNDGSGDNILDFANCFDIKLPVTVVANGTTVTINSEDDIDIIESIFNEFSTDVDTLEINFPITIIFSDYTEMLISNNGMLIAQAAICNGEDEEDDDIECVDFKYPVQISLFNQVSEQTSIITINNDKEMHDFIEDLEDNIIANFQFPITLILFDGTETVIGNLEELEEFIDSAEDDCDEDDDYDFEDDDCVNCSGSGLSDILTTCSDWFVDKLEIGNNDLEDNYQGFLFNFMNDGTLVAVENGNTYPGTWTLSGTGNSLRMLLTIPLLPELNGNWFVHEIEEEPGETKVDLRLGTKRLRFESSCN